MSTRVNIHILCMFTRVDMCLWWLWCQFVPPYHLTLLLQCDIKGLNGLPMSIFEESLRKAKSELSQESTPVCMCALFE